MTEIADDRGWLYRMWHSISRGIGAVPRFSRMITGSDRGWLYALILMVLLYLAGMAAEMLFSGEAVTGVSWLGVALASLPVAALTGFIGLMWLRGPVQ